MQIEKVDIPGEIGQMGLILEKSFNEIYIFDATTLAFLHINEGGRRNLQLTPADLRSLRPTDFKPQFTVAQFDALLAPLRNGEKSQLTYETVHQRRDGSIYPVEVRMQLELSSGVPVIIAIANDISERQAAEALIRESEERLRLALHAGRSGAWDWNMLENTVTWSDRLYDFHGLTPDSFSGKIEDFIRLIHPTDVDRVTQGLQHAIDTHTDFDVEFRIVRPDNQVRWLATIGRAIYNADEKAIRMLGATQDTTARQLAEEALLRSETSFRQLADAMPQVVWAARPDGYVDYYNQRWYDLTASKRDTGGDQSWLPVIHPDDAQQCFDAWHKAVQSGEPYEFEYRLHHVHEGAYHWHLSRALPARNALGEIVRWYGTSTDIDDQKRAAVALYEQTRALETINSVGSAIAAELDLEKLVQAVTDAGVELTGAQFGAFFYNVINDKGEAFTLYTLSGAPREAFAQFPMPRNTAVFGPTFRGEGVIRIADIKKDPRYGKSAPYHGMPEGHLPVTSYLAVPVVSRSGEVLGGLFFGHSEPGVFTARTETILTGIASQAAVAIDNAHLYRTAQKELAERKQAEDALFREKELAQITLRSIGDAVMATDAAGLVTYLNPIAELLTGWRNEAATGLPVEQVFGIVSEETGEAAENPVRVALREKRKVELATHTMLVSRDGQRYSVEDSAAPIQTRSGEQVGVVLVFRDVTVSRALNQQVAYQASHDPLTDLLNRREFEQALEQAIARAAATDLPHALLYIDLDQFKLVNDTRGHLAGDEMLRQLSQLLLGKMRASDTLARLGGDEFGILLQGSLNDAQRFAEMLIDVVRHFRFTWQDKIFAVSVSIGLVPINRLSGDLKSVLSAADTACYMAKDKGRNRLQLFHPEDAEVLHRHGEMDWISRLTHAFEEQRFCLYYQNIYPVSANAAQNHYEVLVRITDEEGRIVTPMAFIPAAERYNMMPTVDRWVIATLFTHLGARYQNKLPAGEQCSVNLSGATISDSGFLDYLLEQFRLTRTPPEVLCFEITETAAIANLERARQFMLALKKLGCRFALDDFGSGLSSFRYLKEFPVDYLKIDGSFIKDIVTDPVSRAMVEAIQRIGSIMNIKTVAEFVENDAILAEVKRIGIDYAQGWALHNAALLV